MLPMYVGNFCSLASLSDSVLIDCACAPSCCCCYSATLSSPLLNVFKATILEAFCLTLLRACWISLCGTFSPACSHCKRWLSIATFSWIRAVDLSDVVFCSSFLLLSSSANCLCSLLWTLLIFSSYFCFVPLQASFEDQSVNVAGV